MICFFEWPYKNFLLFFINIEAGLRDEMQFEIDYTLQQVYVYNISREYLDIFSVNMWKVQARLQCSFSSTDKKRCKQDELWRIYYATSFCVPFSFCACYRALFLLPTYIVFARCQCAKTKRMTQISNSDELWQMRLHGLAPNARRLVISLFIFEFY